MSGGVDSSVSAALLKERGYEVEGAFIVPWSPPWLPCTWRDERLDAVRVAELLRIPFHTVDLSVEYERDVVKYLVREYELGRTPNPDVMCNKHIKFGAFFRWAEERGFDYIATGHYARVESSDASDVRFSHRLLCGVDTAKDQTYFLWTLTQAHLARAIFPVGGLTKREVRLEAERLTLPTARKKDSQGVCFLGKIDMREFLQHYIPPREGAVLDRSGAVLGVHEGAAFITLGQRHGFAVKQASPNDPPLYVIAKDIHANTIMVAPRGIVADGVVERSESRTVHLSGSHWISGVPVVDTLVRCAARFRYRQPLVPVTVRASGDDTASVVFDEAQAYVTAGQSMVLYDGDVCLGGGTIEYVE